MGIEITYHTKKIAKTFSSKKLLVQEYGPAIARKVTMRLDNIRASDSLGMMVAQRIGRCHPLSGQRDGQYAFDLEHPYRLIVEPVYDSPADKAAKNITQVKIIEIMEVTDYHG
mgnify:FL=1